MIELTSTYRELDHLVAGLQGVKNLKGIKFAMLVSKNTRILDDVFKDITEVAKPSEEFIELSKKVAPFANDPQKVEEIESEHQELVKERQAQMDEVKRLLDEECTVHLHPIPEDCLPEDITAEQIYNIDKLLK